MEFQIGVVMLTFEKAFEKYKAYMIRCNYSKITLHKKEDCLKRFDVWCQKRNKEVLSDLKAVSCLTFQSTWISCFSNVWKPIRLKFICLISRAFMVFCTNMILLSVILPGSYLLSRFIGRKLFISSIRISWMFLRICLLRSGKDLFILSLKI